MTLHFFFIDQPEYILHLVYITYTHLNYLTTIACSRNGLCHQTNFTYKLRIRIPESSFWEGIYLTITFDPRISLQLMPVSILNWRQKKNSSQLTQNGDKLSSDYVNTLVVTQKWFSQWKYIVPLREL